METDLENEYRNLVNQIKKFIKENPNYKIDPFYYKMIQRKSQIEYLKYEILKSNIKLLDFLLMNALETQN